MNQPNHCPFESLTAAIHAASQIVVIGHVRPDGDAIGSVLGLTLSLKAAGKNVTPVFEDVVPENLRFLPGTNQIVSPSLPITADLVVVLDTANKERIGSRSLETLQKVPTWINVDHHGTNPAYGTLNHIDSSVPATGQLVYDWIQSTGLPMTDDALQNLYVAISTDTGSFQYPSTTARTHRIAAEMLEAGLDAGRLCRLTYETSSAAHMLLMKALLNEMQLTAEGRVASWQLTLKTKSETGALDGDTEGLIDLMRMINTVVAAVIFEEVAEGKIRVSARSKDERLNVSTLCGQFGGGGHHLAAGARMPGPINDAARKFLTILENEVRRLN